MIKELLQMLGYILKYTIVCFGFVFRAITWYLKHMLDAFSSYPKKSSNKVSIKGEIF